MKTKIKKFELTHDQCKERQARWRKRLAEENEGRDPFDIDDSELLDWISGNFRVIRKVSYLEEI